MRIAVKPLVLTAAAALSLSTLWQPLSIEAAGAGLMLEECYLWDEADVLTTEEEIELSQLIFDTAESIQMNVFVRLGANELSGQEDAREYAIDDYLATFGDSKDSDGVYLYLDLYGSYIDSTDYAPHDYIVTHGIAQLYYTNARDDRISEIFSQMNPHMKRGQEDPYTAVTIFCENLQSYYEKGIPNDYYVYDDEYDQYLYIDEKTDTPVWSDNKPPFIRKKQMTSAFLISFAVGFVIALITMLCIKHHYRFKSQPSAQIYIPSGKIRYGGKTDQFLHKRVSRVKVESESSGSGGGGGGSSSGGFGGGGNSR
ncbi:MAG: TPM domain-containing protein [Oscillospiraceae bacterium]|nr:TPM domain-containing protein [Oscillospiraceae bacterium]MDY2510785.1 TPM domain-containing protein [Ruminococcus callidus]